MKKGTLKNDLKKGKQRKEAKGTKMDKKRDGQKETGKKNKQTYIDGKRTKRKSENIFLCIPKEKDRRKIARVAQVK